MNPIWNLQNHKPDAQWEPPTGTIKEQGLELIRRCDQRDAVLAKRALDAERDGDEECCWMCKAARAENKRMRDKIAADVEKLK